MIRACVSLEPFSPDAEVARFSALRGDTCGAVVTFIGYCRGRSTRGAVTQLELEHYPGFTEGEINRLASATGQKHDVKDLLVIHRAGAIAAGEPIVLVAAMSSWIISKPTRRSGNARPDLTAHIGSNRRRKIASAARSVRNEGSCLPD